MSNLAIFDPIHPKLIDKVKNTLRTSYADWISSGPGMKDDFVTYQAKAVITTVMHHLLIGVEK
jgi:hypothetical protein